jgi:sterol desaturase/sphingolipid hydroxylase (fatty acid hydroxylase superfamily)
MDSASSQVSAWLERLRLDELAASAVSGGVAYFLVITVIVLALEARNGTGLARFRSRTFLNDVIYTVFYRGGIYGVLWGAVFNAFEAPFAFLRIGAAAQLPLWVQLAIFWLLGDFIIYWLHRAQHSHRTLWAFHSVHHSPSEMTTLTQNRRHLLERVYLDLGLYFPLLIVLGIPTGTWPLLWIIFGIFEAMQHAELNWRFGPLYWIVVTPVFHSLHHSTDPRHYNANLGGIFSFWDFLFGTAARERERPAAYGVPGLQMPESISQQLVTPFRMLSGQTDRAGRLRRAVGSSDESV